MSKKIISSVVIVIVLVITYLSFNDNNQPKTAIKELREKHLHFINSHPFKENLLLSKKERKKRGLTPNAYFEQEYLNEINPSTGKTNKKELLKLQKEINQKRALRKSPGDVDNEWVERGPNNVGGRTRALIFDPNDDTNETVIAGGVSGGLWKNTNISNSSSEWVRIGIPENLSVSTIAVDPNNSNIWYVGTGESYVNGDVNGTGLWKTIDGGTTWNNIFGGADGDSVFEGNARIIVNSPQSQVNEYAAVLATDFGGELNTQISGEIVLVDDGTDDTEDGCSSITNNSSVNGKIALIRRGSCAFVDKANNAQDAGAIAVIIINNVAGFPAGMAGDDAGITIPTLMISKKDGNTLVNAESTVNLTLTKSENNSGFNISGGIQHINDIAIRNNSGSSEVYVSAGEAFYSDASPSTLLGYNNVGVYKSTDGNTFNKASIPNRTDGGNYEPNNIEISADNSIYVSTNSDSFGEGGGAIFKSTNGIDFTQVHQVPGGRRTEIVCSSTNPSLIYILAQLSSNPVGVYKTENDFQSVETLPLPNDADNGIPSNDFTRGQSGYDLLLKVDPNNDDIVYLGGIDLFKSTNGGAEWTQISKWSNNNNLRNLDVPLVHADQHGLTFASSSRMIFGNDGGVYFSDDSATTIESRNLGYNTLQFYTVGVGPTTAFNGDYFLAGAQDNGTQFFENATANINSANDISGGDGAYSFFDQDGTDKYLIVNYVYNQGINLYDFETDTWRSINDEDTRNGKFINPEALDSNLDRLYSNYSSDSNFLIRRYSNIKSGTVTTVDLENDLMDASPSALEVSPFTTNATNLFVGLDNGKLLLVKRANSFINNWSEITGNDFVGTVSDISFGENENQIFVTMHNYGVQNIWYTEDGGTTWVPKEGDLPDLPVKTILQNPLNRKEVIIGTDLGVWKTNDITVSWPNWTQSYNGMSNVKVTDLDLRDDNIVFASTYGRGVFSGAFTDAVASIDKVLTDNKTFTVYPTISNGNFTLYAKSDLGKTKINIFDINGKQVYKSNLDFGIHQKQDISVNLKSGVYIVNVIDINNRKSSNKIIIE